MLAIIGILAIMTIGTPRPGAHQQPAAPVRASEKALDPALDLLGRMVGGTWRTTGDFVAEFKYEWRVKGKAIRAVGVIAKGTKDEFPAEALYGWDPEAKKVYYLDFHGHETIYKGLVEARDGKFTGEFDGIVGEKGHYRFEDEFTDNDTVSGTLFGRDKDGKWVKVHSLTFKRHM
jgi:hypothetical protein